MLMDGDTHVHRAQHMRGANRNTATVMTDKFPQINDSCAVRVDNPFLYP